MWQRSAGRRYLLPVSHPPLGSPPPPRPLPQDGSAGFQDQLPHREGPRHVPSEAEMGSEKEFKWGVNVPASAEQAKEELQYVRSSGRGGALAGTAED